MLNTVSGLFITAGVCFLLAVFFQYFTIGYQTMALLFAGGGCLCVLLHLLRQPWQRRLLLALVLLGVVGLCLIEVPIMRASMAEVQEADYVIVLGAGVNGTTPSLSLTNRLVAAEAYLRAYPEAVAVVSGGQGAGEEITEAEAMRRYLVHAGIEQERIIMEEQAVNTQENLAYSKALILEQTGGVLPEPIAIVSSEYHLYRAQYMARELGITATGVAAETTLPILKLNYFIREGAAVLRLWVLGY